MSEQRRRELNNLLGLVAEELDQWGSLCPAEQYLFWVKFFELRDLMNVIDRELGKGGEA